MPDSSTEPAIRIDLDAGCHINTHYSAVVFPRRHQIDVNTKRSRVANYPYNPHTDDWAAVLRDHDWRPVAMREAVGGLIAVDVERQARGGRR